MYDDRVEDDITDPPLINSIDSLTTLTDGVQLWMRSPIIYLLINYIDSLTTLTDGVRLWMISPITYSLTILIH